MDNISEFLSQLDATKIITLSAGDYLFNQNDLSKGVFFVKEGCIKLIRDSVDGNPIIIYIAQTNDSLAEASLFSERYHCHAKADTPSEIYFYDKESILNRLSGNAAATLEFVEAQAKQIQQLRLQLELRGIRSPEERFMQYLHLMIDTDKTLKIKSTYKDLAISLGMAHETLYRILKKLENEAIIIREETKIILQV